MNYREVVENSSKLSNSCIDMCALCDSLGIYGVGMDRSAVEERFTMRWAYSWICTDTRVGLDVVYLDGRPIGIFSQTARKNDPEVEFFSRADADEARALVLSAIQYPNPLVSLDKEIDSSWRATRLTGENFGRFGQNSDV